MATTLCMVADAVGPFNAIGKVAADGVRVALGAGYRVTVVAKHLDESLRADVEWLPLYVPRRGFAVQWLTGRHWIKRAIGRRRFDVLHVHQPQAADLADVYQCHFLTRVAYERRCLERGPSLRSRIVRGQQQVVLHAEDYHYRKWNPATRMLFVSDLVAREFSRLYGSPRRQMVLPNPCPPARIPSDADRRRARQQLVGSWRGKVVGFLGGVQERKGFGRLVAGIRGDDRLFLLLGGQFTDGLAVPGLEGRMRGLGHVHDLDPFYAACDVLAVPSEFDPCPLVVLEAAARGVPTLVAEGVGNGLDVVRIGAGLGWAPDVPLGHVVEQIFDRYPSFQAGSARMTEENALGPWGGRLLDVYENVVSARP